MEAQTKKRAARSPVAPAAITETQLTAFEQSLRGKSDNAFVRRLIAAYRLAQSRIWEVEDELRRERELRSDESEKRESNPVLVVVHVDGWVDIYAERGSPVSTIELSILDSEEEETWKERVPFYAKHLLDKTPVRTAFPKYLSRPNQLNDETLARACEIFNRSERHKKVRELAEAIKEQLNAKKIPENREA